MSEPPVRVWQGDALAVLRGMPSDAVHCCVTSPPYYGLRDYNCAGQIGLEATPEEYVARLVEVFREARRVLRGDGTLWLNLGDSYAGSWGAQGHGQMTDRSVVSARQMAGMPKKGSRTGALPPGSSLKPKDLIGVPWMVAFALRSDGWYLRQDIVWAKPNPMPESVRDRCTKAHEYVFLLSKSATYHFDGEAIAEPSVSTSDPRFGVGRVGYAADAKSHHADPEIQRTHMKACVINPTRNKRSVWTVPTCPCPEAHFAVFPPALVEPCVLAGCPEGGVVLDPFAGSGTTGQVAYGLGRRAWLVELNEDYCGLIRRRMARAAGPLFAGGACAEAERGGPR